jgi:hypothetical protein
MTKKPTPKKPARPQRAADPQAVQAQQIEIFRRWYLDPSDMCRDLWQTEPDAWQMEVFRVFRTSPRIAMAACAGPGKSWTLAVLCWNFLLTRPNCWIGVTSITKDNLASGLWTELARLYEKSELLKKLFDMTKTYIAYRQSPATWKLEARTWAKDADPTAIGSALRGPHTDYIMWVLDETGDYPNSVLPVCENIFASSPKEAHIVMAGNPLKLDGPLYRACTVAKDLWHVARITADPDDPLRTPRIPVEYARQQIEQYGRDDPYVMVNILGQFPSQNFNSLISMDEVRASMNRMYREFELVNTARILGVDVARDGLDFSIISRRRGLQMYPMSKYRNIDSIQGASLVAREWTEFKADATFVDSTGGFGAGWIDQLKVLGHAPVGIHFNETALKTERYVNKRTEMMFEMVDWIKRGGAIPNDDRLAAALTQTTYIFRKDRVLIEPKDNVKRKIGYSPDEMDAAILTFAAPVAPKTDKVRRYGNKAVSDDYNPFREMETPTGNGGW